MLFLKAKKKKILILIKITFNICISNQPYFKVFWTFSIIQNSSNLSLLPTSRAISTGVFDLLHYPNLGTKHVSLRVLGGKNLFSSAQSCPTLCNPMNHSTPGLPVHHQLPESTQTHVHRVDHANQPSPLSFPSCPALSLCQHEGLFQWVCSSHQVAKVLELQLKHQSFQWTSRTGLL